jgi:hypothetical protein
LDFLRYAERELLAQKPGLLDAPVFVHFHEDRGEALKAGSGYDAWDDAASTKSERWGPLATAGMGDVTAVAEDDDDAFSRARDLWTGGEGQVGDAPDVLDVGAVGALIEGALAGGGDATAVEKVAASR